MRSFAHADEKALAAAEARRSCGRLPLPWDTACHNDATGDRVGTAHQDNLTLPTSDHQGPTGVKGRRPAAQALGQTISQANAWWSFGGFPGLPGPDETHAYGRRRQRATGSAASSDASWPR